MSQPTIRIGVAGAGPRGRYLARLYSDHPQCTVTAICDPARPRAEAAAANLGRPDIAIFTGFEEMLKAAALDALVITAPPDIQVDLACAAMERGIHVTTEVPAAYSIEQCWNLVRTVEKTGAKYQLSEQTRFWGFIQEWRAMARRGDFGQILFAEGEYLHFEAWDYWFDPRTGETYRGSAAPPEGKQVVKTWRHRTFIHPIYYLPHTLSPLLSITGGRITRVSCMGNRPKSYHVEGLETRDMEIALMHTSSDTVLRVAAGFTSPHGPRRATGYHWYQVVGTRCTVEWSRTPSDLPKMWTPTDGWREVDWGLVPGDVPLHIRQSGHGGADWWPVDAFVGAILGKGEVSMNVYDAVETAAPAILAAESAEEGGALKEVPDFRRGA